MSETTDGIGLIERLSLGGPNAAEAADEAIAEIERLRSEVASLQAALDAMTIEAAKVQIAVLGEREACAKIADEIANHHANHGKMTDASIVNVVADAIRARGTP